MMSKNVMLLIALAVFWSHWSMGQVVAVKMEIPVENVYIPRGYDSNDNIEFVAEGALPNLCYQYPVSKIKKVDHDIFLVLETTYYKDPEKAISCAQVVVPFTSTVKVGLLKAGTYNLHYLEQGRIRKSKTFEVEQAPIDVSDNYIYARVEYIDKEQGDNVVYIKGANPSSCVELDRIEVISNEVDTYAVLPIMKRVADICPLVMVPFSYRFEVPRSITRDKVLLHVRSIEGTSVNKILD